MVAETEFAGSGAPVASVRESERSLSVLLIGNYPLDKQESMNRFVSMLARELPLHGIHVKVVSPKPYFGKLRPSPVGLGKWLGYFDKFLIFPFTLRRSLKRLRSCDGNGDSRGFQQNTHSPVVAHICDHSNAIYSRYLQAIPHVVTCHDLLAIRSARGETGPRATSWSGSRYQALILAGLNRSRRIVCDSEATRTDLIRLSNHTQGSASLVYLGLNYPYAPISRHEAGERIAKLLVSGSVMPSRLPSYILHVGGDQWYKNRMGVLEIYTRLRELMAKQTSLETPKLVFVGQQLTQEMKGFLALQPGIAEDVITVEAVSNEELASLYSCAELLLFPSREEGFGWPIIEAQSCGCRVVTTGKPPMTEIGGKAALYLDAQMIRDAAAETDAKGRKDLYTRAARVVLDFLNESGLARQIRVEEGILNARRFSTDRMVKDYAQYYRSIAAA